MRILHISTRLILGGSQENTVLSCEGQARLGHDVHLAFGPILGPEGSLLQRVEAFRPAPSAQPITTHLVPDLVRELHVAHDRRALRQLREIVRALEPDVVHTHSSKAGILGRVAAWQARKHMPVGKRPAIVHTIHGPPFMPVEGPPLRRVRIALVNHMYTLAERHAAGRCDSIVSVADAMTTQFLDRGIGRPELYSTVRSGMELEPFLRASDPAARAAVRARLGLTADDFVIGTVARLAEHKGHDDLLDALAEELISRPRWKLLWVGDGWWKDRLAARVAHLGLQGRVLMTGLVPPQHVPDMLAAMDLLAHPSVREGLPRTVPQALLAGVCPVAYDVDGTKEVCIDGTTGKLVPPRNLSALRSAIIELHDHPQRRASMVLAGQHMCTEAFDARLMVEHLERVYAHALERARTARATPGAGRA